ncbi:MAG: hypothetical protein AAGA85_10050 [Bacteroidota bacterium]
MLGFLFLTAQGQQIEVIYEASRAVGVRCVGCSTDIDVKLTGQSTGILGRIRENDSENEVSFYPAIAFNSRLTYELWQGYKLIGRFRPEKTPNPKTQLLSIYRETMTINYNIGEQCTSVNLDYGEGSEYRF